MKRTPFRSCYRGAPGKLQAFWTSMAERVGREGSVQSFRKDDQTGPATTPSHVHGKPFSTRRR